MILLIYAITVLLALTEADLDHTAIRLNQRIDHIERWAFRAVLVGLWCVAGLPFNATTTGMAIAAIGAAFLFSAVFRHNLNRLRGLPFDYVSRSNVYDSVLIGLFGDSAGRAAYVTEALITAAALVAYF